ncbi:Similarity with UbiE/COQ5 methyltransferase [Mycobacteroides abscessus]|nr:Similarity with UbiE/COQ5 methyltransferase [Mycobacteroides abscessus]
MLHHPTLADSLIDPARIDHPPRRDHGYLDVLGPESDEPVSVANRFMQSPLLAAIYERAWRPMFTRGFSYGGKSTLKAHTALMNEIAGRGDHKILDVACGPGLYTRELAAQLGKGRRVYRPGFVRADAAARGARQLGGTGRLHPR